MVLMTALQANNTWELVSITEGKIYCWMSLIYTVKVGLDGKIELKACLVSQGYRDHGEVFSPVAKIVFV